MSTQSTKIEQRLRRLALKHLQESPTLWEHFRQERRARRPSIGRILLYIYSGLTAGSGLLVTPIGLSVSLLMWFRVDGILGFHSLVTLIATYGLTFGLRLGMKQSRYLSIMSHLPSTDQEIAWRVCRDGMLVSLIAVYLNLCFYGYLAWEQPRSVGWLEVLFVAAGQWLICVATATILAAWIHERLLKISLVMLCIALAAFCFLDRAHLDDANSIVFLMLPTGWLNGLLNQGIVRDQAIAMWLLIPVAAWCLFGIWSQLNLVAKYRIDEFLIRQGLPAEAIAKSTSIFETNPAAEPMSWSRRLPGELVAEDESVQSAAELAARVRSREFVTPQDWSKLGWIERLVDRWLTPNERTVVEFVTSEQIQWTKYWGVTFTQVLIFFCYAWLEGNFDASILFASFGVAPAIMMLGPWPAFRCRSCGGVYSAQFAIFPVDRDEVATALMKVAAIRSLSTLCFLLVPCAILTMKLPFWPLSGILLAVAFCALTMILALWHIVWLLTSGSAFPDWRWRNTGRRLMLSTLRFTTGLSLYILMVVGMIIGLKWWPVSVVCVGLIVLCSVANWRLSRRFHLSGAFDLVRSRPSTWDQYLEQCENAHFKAKQAAELRKKHGWFWWLKRELRETESA